MMSPLKKLTLDRLFGDPDINGISPISLKFSPDGKHVTYLKSAEDNFEQLNLCSYDIASGETQVLVEAKNLLNRNRALSDAEKARRERLRIIQTGIVEYYWSPKSDALLFPVDGNLHLYQLTSKTSTQLTNDETFETNIRFSPDSKFLSFIRDQDLFVIDLGSGETSQLTNDGGGVISNGVAEFIAQEEMHRYDGYWWSPDSSFIAFTRVDESPVQLSQRYEIDADSFGVYDQRYPFAGTPNANVQIGVIEVTSKQITRVALDRHPESYIPRVNWLCGGKDLAIQIQSRDQQDLSLIFWNVESHESKKILEEHSSSWINLNNNFHSLPDGLFIWGSERSGFNHLYLINQEGEIERHLTDGDWVVADFKGVADNNRLYFDGFKDTPLEKHLYETSLDGDVMTRLTEPGFNHQVELSPDCKTFIDRCSSALLPTSVSLRDITGELTKTLEPNGLDRAHPFYDYAETRGEVSFGELKADDGQTLHYRLIKPVGFSSRKRYPLIVTVYGGPGVQRVANEWIPPWHHYMSQRGFALFQLDNRGSSNRGKSFEEPLYGQLGKTEVEDQLKGVDYTQQLDWIDANRIGVFGHSYGGYMTLMLMMKSGAFKAGVSVAPVTDWSLYDTHYTERYLRHPKNNPKGYRDSNVFPYVNNLSGKILIIHGMADDNVLFSNSTKLYKALQDQNIEFEIMNYPGAKHGLVGRKTNIHRYGTMDRFIDTHLLST